MTNATTTTTETADRLRLVIGKLSRHLRLTVTGGGLTPTGISVLFTVVRAGPVRLSDLAEVEGLNPTMLSRLVTTLADDGLVTRVADPTDRRAAVIEATAAGRTLREQVHRQYDDVLTAHLTELDAEDHRALEDALPALEQLAEQLKGGRR